MRPPLERRADSLRLHRRERGIAARLAAKPSQLRVMRPPGIVGTLRLIGQRGHRSCVKLCEDPAGAASFVDAAVSGVWP